MRLNRLVFISLLLLAPAVHAKVEMKLELDRDAVAPGGAAGLEVLAEIERGWHINAHKPNEPFLIPTQVTITGPPGITIEPPTYPPPDKRTFAFARGKELLVYEGKLGITTGIKVAEDFTASEAKLEALLTYQSCNDTTCLPPAKVKAELTIPVRKEVAAVDSGVAGGSPEAAGPDFANWLETRGLLATVAVVFFLGLGLNLTPCVYPLISVTIAYFGSQAHRRTSRTVLLASAYVLGVTVTFALLGVAAAYSGGIFGSALQKPAVLIGIAAMLAALAMSSFGYYQLQPPAWLMQRVGAAAPGALGSFLMGATMGIVAAPCVGPVVVGLLVFVGSQQSAALGLLLFFALGLGLGTPYLGLALAAGAIQRLPRSGEWMMWVERLFGFILLAMSLYFVKPLLPPGIAHWVMPSLCAVAGLYLGFVDPAGRTWPRFRRMQWTTGTIALVFAGWLALPNAAQSAIRWEAFNSAAWDSGAGRGQPALIDFVADWCIPCHEMDSTTFQDATVIQQAKRFRMFKADLTRENDESSALADKFKIEGVPTVIYIDSRGNEVHRKVGYVGPAEMADAMRTVE